MGTLDVHQNIPASDTNLTSSLRINFISPPLVMVKIIPIRAITSPPKMSLLLEAERTDAVAIKPRPILVATQVTLVRTKHSTRGDKCTFNLSTGLSALQILHQGSSPIASQTAVQLTRCFRSTLILTYKLGIACAIEMAAESDELSGQPIVMLQQPPVLG